MEGFSNIGQLVSMDSLKMSKKEIRVFCISNHKDQEEFNSLYNNDKCIVTILRDYFDKDGLYFLAVEIRHVDKSEDEQ